MSQQPDTGETVAQANARRDDAGWANVRADLEAGFFLQRPAKMRDFYTTAPFRRVLGASRVAKLEREGVLTRIGVDTYGLAEALK